MGNTVSISLYSNDPFPTTPIFLCFSCTVASGASGSFSTNSPASPLSSVSLTSPLSPFSPVPGSQASPTKQLGPEVSTGHTQLGTNPNPKPGTGVCSDSRTNPEVRRRLSPKPRPKSCTLPHFKTDPKLRCRPKSYRESDTSWHTEHINYYGCEAYEHTFPQPSLAFQNHRESLGRLDPVIEETDQNISYRTNFDQPINQAKARAEEHKSTVQVKCHDSKYTNKHSDTVQTHSDPQEVSWLSSSGCLQEVRVGLRKDVYPDSYPSQFSAGYHNGNLSSNRRCSMPESKILPFQDSCQTDVLSLCYGPGLYAHSVPCFSSDSPETQHHHQLPFLSSYHDGESARPLTYPNNQLKLDKYPLICATTQSDSTSNHSNKVFLQSHL